MDLAKIVICRADPSEARVSASSYKCGTLGIEKIVQSLAIYEY